MKTILSKKDYKIIGISSKNPEKVIIELDQEILNNLIGTKKRIKNNKLVLSWLNDKDEGVLKSKTEINTFLKNI